VLTRTCCIMLLNLIDNAARYRRPERPSVWQGFDDGGVVLSVIDRGPDCPTSLSGRSTASRASPDRMEGRAARPRSSYGLG
jgi:K+-sensing histidine kinase KdpD